MMAQFVKKFGLMYVRIALQIRFMEHSNMRPLIRSEFVSRTTPDDIFVVPSRHEKPRAYTRPRFAVEPAVFAIPECMICGNVSAQLKPHL
jgi:hypothetical protein